MFPERGQGVCRCLGRRFPDGVEALRLQEEHPSPWEDPPEMNDPHLRRRCS